MREEKKDIFKIINRRYENFSKSQKLIADYIIENYDKAAFMTASKLGETVGISESTIVRFADALDFSGYPELQKALQELIKTKLTTVQRFELTNKYTSDTQTILNVMDSDIQNIRETMNELDKDMLEKVTSEILCAKRVYILGLRSSAVLAEYLGFYLNFILKDVHVIKAQYNDVYEQLINISSEDVVIALSFPRYSRRTYESVRLLRRQGCKIISITDSKFSPLASISEMTLFAKNNVTSFVDSLVAPMSLINLLIVSISLQEKELLTETFRKLEAVWDEFNIYSKS
ncbi:MAG: MurR/RpiR family transcriptional regulator [Peptostreptococcaceae bacterium]|nr:MurR/RpiR family transcriptional regulator [Peptostreptococcaceae bacterium]